MKNSKILKATSEGEILTVETLYSIEGHTKFDDLDGVSAQEVTEGYVIYHTDNKKSSVGFYNRVHKFVIAHHGAIHKSPTQQSCDGLQQAMRFIYLMMQKEKEADVKEVTYGPDRIMRFRDMPGILVHIYRATMDSGKRSVGGFNIYDNNGNHVAHYMRRSKNLWLHPTDVVTCVQRFPNLLQAVRFVYLNIQEPSPSA